jgi:nucleoside-triphosphatase THEP1
MIALVTGEIGCGKTTVCERAIDLLRARGLAPSGVLSLPRLDENGVKTGIDALDVVTGEQRRLANLVPGGGETIGDYTFDRASLDWVIGRLLAAIAGLTRAGECDVVVVDEIGPLELERQGGFAVVLGPLADPNLVPHGLVVVRCEFVDLLELRLGRSDARRFWVDIARRERLPGEIAAVFD